MSGAKIRPARPNPRPGDQQHSPRPRPTAFAGHVGPPGPAPRPARSGAAPNPGTRPAIAASAGPVLSATRPPAGPAPPAPHLLDHGQAEPIPPATGSADRRLANRPAHWLAGRPPGPG